MLHSSHLNLEAPVVTNFHHQTLLSRPLSPFLTSSCIIPSLSHKSFKTDPGTFEREPEGAPELFDDWLDSFVLEQHAEEISRLLGTVLGGGGLEVGVVLLVISRKVDVSRMGYDVLGSCG